MTAFNLLLAAGVGAVIGGIIYTLDWLSGDDQPIFWGGLVHRWTGGLGILAIVVAVIMWAARYADFATVVAIILGTFGAAMGAYLAALAWAILSAAWGLLTDFMKPTLPGDGS